MDIHLPKPFHNWREFLKEYGIIVLGVLTALGLEQAIEAIHHHSEVQEAREALNREMAHNPDFAPANARPAPMRVRAARRDRTMEDVVGGRASAQALGPSTTPDLHHLRNLSLEGYRGRRSQTNAARRTHKLCDPLCERRFQ
jgi:plasmid stability protein